jgi:hypothetical protein
MSNTTSMGSFHKSCRKGHDLTVAGSRRAEDNRCLACYREKYPTERGSEAWLANVEAGRVGTNYGAPLGNRNSERAICKSGLHEMNDDNRIVVKTARGTLSTVCGKCRSARQRKALYGISAVEYAEMLVQHGGVCATCKRPPKAGRSLCVDHNHRTGKVRGLLCDKCNQALGKAEDSIERLWALIQYLDERN